MRPSSLKIAVMAATIAVSATASPAQEAGETQRFPERGIPILDCAPSAPAPAASCLLRVPPGYQRGGLRVEAEAGATPPELRILQSGEAGFPEGLTLSRTLVLVDLSPGPEGGRRATFARERALIGEFVAALPGTEPVALYGFNEELVLLQDFTTDRDALGDAIAALELRGTNTRIATFVGDAVSILAERDDTLLRNLVLVSDGQEEGSQPVEEVVARAVDAGVTISAIGTFWRPVGTAATGRGMDYLRRLSEDSLGIAAPAILRRGDAAGQAVATFASDISSAIGASGLIMPQGEPTEAVIGMTLREPVMGAPGEFRDREVEVAYLPQPEASIEGAEAPTAAPDDAEAAFFGIPLIWAYVAGAVLALLALLAIVGVFLRRARAQAGASEDHADEEVPVDAPKAPPVPQAFLVFEEGRRLAIGKLPASIGRGDGNEIVIEDDSISRVHAQLHRNRDGGLSITDLASLNGTFINGERIAGTAPLRLDDTLSFGRVSTRLTPA